MEASRPDVSVVVPSHERGTRLRWLLNALEEQTLPRERWELVVVFDSTDDTEELVRTHPLAREGVLRSVQLEPGTGSPSR
jgi:glycosyltransferase involved in cell wall biosynthesis